MNLGLQASARSENPAATERVIEAGAVGLKIHEDWGAYPEIIDATLRWPTRTTSRSACTPTG